MRPVKQAGVVGTHTIVNFAPAPAAASSGAVLLLLHVSRLGFFFVSACMLTYTYADLNWRGLPRFYWRRFLSVGAPYLCWTVIYFFFLMPTTRYHDIGSALQRLARMAETGYYQLYFLLVIMQFYVVFPLVLLVLRRTRGHHGLVLAAAGLAQLGMSVLTHWELLPRLMLRYAQEDGLSYVFYLAGGCVVAFHLEAADAWVRRHARLVVALTAVAALAAEGVYFLDRFGVTSLLGSGSDPFQPSVVPFNIGAIACVYLTGVALVRAGRSRFTRAVVRAGADNAFGIYLTHMLFITVLLWLGWKNLDAVIPWPLLCLLTVVIVVACGAVLTALLARTPLAVPLTGRRRVPWKKPGRAGAREPRAHTMFHMVRRDRWLVGSHDERSTDMPMVTVKVIEGVFTAEQKRAMISRITDAMVEVEGESLRPVTWVLVEEVHSGDWGIAGNSLSTADVHALQGQPAAAATG